MLGAAIGDIVGSPYEWAPIKTKEFPLFGAGAGPTDDTVCTAAVAEALLNGTDPALCLRRWGRRYPGSGYGGSFRRWLEDDAAGPYRSWGNGAAMRVSPVGWLAETRDDVLALAERVTAVTHDHPEGIRGAQATALAVWLARAGADPREIRQAVAQAFAYDLSPSLADIRPSYSFEISCQGTVPPAILCAVEATGFEDAVRNAVSLGGDADTLAAIAGAIAEPLFGIPDAIRSAGRSHLTDDILSVLDAAYAASPHPSRAAPTG